jgi:hypothetical protein
MKGTRQSEVASIGKRSDDETTCVAKILVAVGELGIHCTHEELVVPVVPAMQMIVMDFILPMNLL